MEISKQSSKINFNLEISNDDSEGFIVRLTNLYNNYTYIPAIQNHVSETFVSAARKTGFVVSNIFDIQNPVVSAGNYELKFKPDPKNELLLLKITNKHLDMRKVVSELKSLKTNLSCKINEIDACVDKSTSQLNDFVLQNQAKLQNIHCRIEKLGIRDKTESKMVTKIDES